ncbi:MAG: type II toxin-antitoxin system RelE/ParE family toxin [Rhodocyclaceae bacterium]|nr:type II toxin-antitoxin system RelE/ParE family toxin [Rhodocyclaceae bacterium]
MAAKRTPVRLAANFEANLAQIEAYLAEAETPQAYDELLDVLLETVIPNLERHPRMGRPLLDRPAQSVEGRDAIDRLRKQIAGGELREYLTGDYLILYALIREFVILLSIKHHRQLSFALEKHWP